MVATLLEATQKIITLILVFFYRRINSAAFAYSLNRNPILLVIELPTLWVTSADCLVDCLCCAHLIPICREHIYARRKSLCSDRRWRSYCRCSTILPVQGVVEGGGETMTERRTGYTNGAGNQVTTSKVRRAR